MGERVYLVADGVDRRVHHLEVADSVRIDELHQSMIVEAAPLAARPRASDLNIADMTGKAGIFRPSAHIERASEKIERIEGDSEAFVRSHVRRLETLRRAGHVERLDADTWRVPADIGASRIASFTRVVVIALGAGTLAYVAMMFLPPVLFGVAVIGG
jgi:hypothetical protein